MQTQPPPPQQPSTNFENDYKTAMNNLLAVVTQITQKVRNPTINDSLKKKLAEITTSVKNLDVVSNELRSFIAGACAEVNKANRYAERTGAVMLEKREQLSDTAAGIAALYDLLMGAQNKDDSIKYRNELQKEIQKLQQLIKILEKSKERLRKPHTKKDEDKLGVEAFKLLKQQYENQIKINHAEVIRLQKEAQELQKKLDAALAPKPPGTIIDTFPTVPGAETDKDKKITELNALLTSNKLLLETAQAAEKKALADLKAFEQDAIAKNLSLQGEITKLKVELKELNVELEKKKIEVPREPNNVDDIIRQLQSKITEYENLLVNCQTLKQNYDRLKQLVIDGTEKITNVVNLLQQYGTHDDTNYELSTEYFNKIAEQIAIETKTLQDMMNLITSENLPGEDNRIDEGFGDNDDDEDDDDEDDGDVGNGADLGDKGSFLPFNNNGDDMGDKNLFADNNNGADMVNNNLFADNKEGDGLDGFTSDNTIGSNGTNEQNNNNNDDMKSKRKQPTTPETTPETTRNLKNDVPTSVFNTEYIPVLTIPNEVLQNIPKITSLYFRTFDNGTLDEVVEFILGKLDGEGYEIFSTQVRQNESLKKEVVNKVEEELDAGVQNGFLTLATDNLGQTVYRVFTLSQKDQNLIQDGIDDYFFNKSKTGTAAEIAEHIYIKKKLNLRPEKQKQLLDSVRKILDDASVKDPKSLTKQEFKTSEGTRDYLYTDIRPVNKKSPNVIDLTKALNKSPTVIDLTDDLSSSSSSSSPTSVSKQNNASPASSQEEKNLTKNQIDSLKNIILETIKNFHEKNNQNPTLDEILPSIHKNNAEFAKVTKESIQQLLKTMDAVGANSGRYFVQESTGLNKKRDNRVLDTLHVNKDIRQPSKVPKGAPVESEVPVVPVVKEVDMRTAKDLLEQAITNLNTNKDKKGLRASIIFDNLGLNVERDKQKFQEFQKLLKEEANKEDGRLANLEGYYSLRPRRSTRPKTKPHRFGFGNKGGTRRVCHRSTHKNKTKRTIKRLRTCKTKKRRKMKKRTLRNVHRIMKVSRSSSKTRKKN